MKRFYNFNAFTIFLFDLLFFSQIIEKNPDPEWTLLFYLRKKLNLCGTKLGCAEGGCGACTVMVSKYDYNEKKPMYPFMFTKLIFIAIS